MTRFVAIPVNVGDAFYLERDGHSILVDGGSAKEAFPGLFRHYTRKCGADIVVCTHNDADHANGIIGFLEAGLTCQEIWLPGSWLATIKDLMRPDTEVYQDIINGAREFLDHFPPYDELPSTIEEVGKQLSNSETSSKIDLKYEDHDDGAIGGWPNDIAETIEEYENSIRVYDWPEWWHKYILPIPNLLKFPSWYGKVVIEAIEAGKRIKQIAELAYSKGIPVRWFKHDLQHPSGDINNFLKVLSARQIIHISLDEHLFQRIALTTVNKESLVLYSPGDTCSPGVLFCADSDLQEVRIPVRPFDLVTVPHHGSQANKAAYTAVLGVIGQQLSTLTWVRSDRYVRSRPCLEYCNLPGRKFCTMCNTRYPQQSVVLFSRKGYWVRHSKVTRCSCTCQS